MGLYRLCISDWEAQVSWQFSVFQYINCSLSPAPQFSLSNGPSEERKETGALGLAWLVSSFNKLSDR